jgi:Zn-dependent M16 (insulinase) family peptidase
LPQTQYIKPSAQIRRYDAEDIFELLKSRDQELTLDDLVEIRKQSALVEAAGPEPEPESEERTVRALKLTEGLGLTEGGIKVFEVRLRRAVSSNN